MLLVFTVKTNWSGFGFYELRIYDERFRQRRAQRKVSGRQEFKINWRLDYSANCLVLISRRVVFAKSPYLCHLNDL